MPVEKFKKRSTHVRSWLDGMANSDPKYFTAIAALEFAAKHHTGMRADGKTPEFDHQLSQMQHAFTLHHSIIYPMELYATIALHDTMEDFDVDRETIMEVCGSNRMLSNAQNKEYATRIADAVWAMTKKFRGVKKTNEEYFGDLSQDIVASLGKGFDRGHNHGSMVGVFTIEKQKKQIEETLQWIIPMLKKARKNFPEQRPAYQNLYHFLMSQVELITAIHEASEA